MKLLRFVGCFALVCSLVACAGMNKTKDKQQTKAHEQPKIKDAAGDVSFQAFLGRLRKAVASHDVPEIASMMTPNFAYVMGATPDQDRTGEGVFQYWDENGLWPELQAVLREKFAPKDNFMVAPPQFALSPDDYHGYRAGMQMVNGSWKFAYFVTD